MSFGGHGLDGLLFGGLDGFFGQLGAVVFGIGRREEQFERLGCSGRGVILRGFFEGATMGGEGAKKSFNRGKETFLQIDEDQALGGTMFRGQTFEALFTSFPIFVEQPGQLQFGSIGRQVFHGDLKDAANGKTAGDFAQVRLEAADHDFVAEFWFDGRTADEPLRIEDFEQGGEAVGQTIVRGGGEKQTVLETFGQVAHGAGELRIDGILGAGGRGGMMGFVEDEQRAGVGALSAGAIFVRIEQISEGSCIIFVAQEGMGENEARVGGPRIDGISTLAADTGDVIAVVDDEGESEALFELFAPLNDDGGRGDDDDAAHALAHEHFA